MPPRLLAVLLAVLLAAVLAAPSAEQGQACAENGRAGCSALSGQAEAAPSAPPLGAESLDPAGSPMLAARLDFGQRYVCTPTLQSTQLVNPSQTSELLVTAVRSDSAHFHPSLVEPTSVPPGGRLNISVVLLPRVVGPIEGLLTVETAAGTFDVRLRAEGLASPFELLPVYRWSVPLGASFSPALRVFNPDESAALTVKEVYTSENFLHLRMPAGAELLSTPKVLWQVPPRVAQVRGHEVCWPATCSLTEENASPGDRGGLSFEAWPPCNCHRRGCAPAGAGALIESPE